MLLRTTKSVPRLPRLRVPLSMLPCSACFSRNVLFELQTNVSRCLLMLLDFILKSRIQDTFRQDWPQMDDVDFLRHLSSFFATILPVISPHPVPAHHYKLAPSPHISHLTCETTHIQFCSCGSIFSLTLVTINKLLPTIFLLQSCTREQNCTRHVDCATV